MTFDHIRKIKFSISENLTVHWLRVGYRHFLYHSPADILLTSDFVLVGPSNSEGAGKVSLLKKVPALKDGDFTLAEW